MASLQKVALGTPPSALDGDTVRVANTKANANVDVLNTQAALTSVAAITAAQALTTAHVGRRVNVSLANGGTINLPAASTCAADQVIHLRNVGTGIVTLAITPNSGDTLTLTRLNPGESALMDTDGVHAWTVLLRGRSSGASEYVPGSMTVGGASDGKIFGQSSAGASVLALGVGTLNGFSDSVGLTSTTSTGVLDFGTNATVRVRINAAGRVLVGNGQDDGSSLLQVAGATSVNGTLTLAYPGSATYSNRLIFAASTYRPSMRADISTQTIQFINSANTAVTMSVNDAGAVTCTSLTQTSDRRLKSDVVTISGAMEKLRPLRGVYFTMAGVRRIGVIAQEVKVTLPELVNEVPVHRRKRLRGGPVLGVNYADLSGVLLQGLLETDAELAKVSMQLRAAVARIEALEKAASK